MPPTHRNATMREVAERAGVAVSSVSRVLNHHPDVSEAMRTRVMAAVSALGYEPDLLAQSLRRGSTKTVGFIVRDISNPLFADIVRGAEMRLRQDGYSLVLTNSDGDPGLDAQHIQLLNRRRVDGLIMSLESETHPPTLAALSGVMPSMVLVDREVPAIRASAVISDHYLGVREGVLDMLRREGAAVAFLGGPDDVWASRERFRAYLSAHEAIGRTPDRRLMRTGSYLEDAGYDRTIELLDRWRPTGILAGGAQLSLGSLRALVDSGVELGVDVDFVACDGIPLMRTFRPSISMVERDATQIGRVAAELLVHVLETGGRPRVVTLPTEYVQRDTVRTGAGQPTR